MRVALTRESGHNDELRDLVGARADVVEVPLTATLFRPLRDVDEEIRSLRDFGHFRSLVVTSARCDRYVSLARVALGETPHVFSVGPTTTAALRRLDLEVSGESSGTARDLEQLITSGPVLLLGATAGRRELSDVLDARRLSPSRVECYSTIEVTPDEVASQRLRDADVVFIGAPSAWGVARGHVSSRAWVLVPGDTTLRCVQSDHSRVLTGWGDDFESAWELISTNP